MYQPTLLLAKGRSSYVILPITWWLCCISNNGALHHQRQYKSPQQDRLFKRGHFVYTCVHIYFFVRMHFEGQPSRASFIRACQHNRLLKNSAQTYSTFIYIACCLMSLHGRMFAAGREVWKTRSNTSGQISPMIQRKRVSGNKNYSCTICAS